MDETVIFTFDDDDLQEMFRGAGDKVKNLKPAMEAFGEYMLLQTEEERFAKEQDPEGNPWTPLAPSTLKQKQHNKILTEHTERGGRWLRGSIIKEAGPNFIMIGTNNIAYAGIHQLGGKAGKGHRVDIPARPYFGFNEKDMQEFSDTAKDYIES